MKHNLFRIFLTAMLVLVTQQATAGDSGFIENLPQLREDPTRPGAKIWTKPDVDRAYYTRVMLAPVTIFVSPESEYKGMSAKKLIALADEFHDTLTQTLEPEIQVVNEPGKGVLYVRAAITDIKITKEKAWGIIGYTPVGFLAGKAREATGDSLSLQGAFIEVESLDSESGERIGVLIDKAPETAENEELSWESINKTFAYYAGRFKFLMHEAQ